MSVVEDIVIPSITLWLLLGAPILIATTRRVAGRRKLLWIGASLAPLILAVLFLFIAIKFFPQYSSHIDMGDLSATYFCAVLGGWIVYGVFKWAHTPSMTPNPTIERDAREQAARAPHCER